MLRSLKMHGMSQAVTDLIEQGGYNTSNHTTGITINLFSIKNIPTDTSNLTLNLYAHAWGSNDFGYYCSASISGVTGTYLKLS